MSSGQKAFFSFAHRTYVEVVATVDDAVPTGRLKVAKHLIRVYIVVSCVRDGLKKTFMDCLVRQDWIGLAPFAFIVSQINRRAAIATGRVTAAIDTLYSLPRTMQTTAVKLLVYAVLVSSSKGPLRRVFTCEVPF